MSEQQTTSMRSFAIVWFGQLAGTVGDLIGVGAGRGIGFLHVVTGLCVALLAIAGRMSSHVRHIETELPDLAGR